MTTSLFAIIVGLVLVNIFKPGAEASINLPEHDVESNGIKPFSETLIEIVPTNIFEAFQKTDMLAIIFFAILVGFFITQLPENHKKTLNGFFSAFFELMMKITLFIIKFAPLGVLGLFAAVVAEQQDITALFRSLAEFIKTCVAGLTIHFILILPLIMFIVGQVNPIKHIKAMITPLLTAFSTASSNATLPLTMDYVENESKVSNKISSFTLPLGATINMDGTALYEIVVAGFVAQLYGYDLSFVQQIIMVATALLASIGTAAIPMASLVTMTIIFSAIGLPLEAIAIIIPIDRPLDMLRTATNVWSDSCGAVIIAKSEGESVYPETIP
jgi:Na+/H+-dicarboxylate symporter